MKINKSVLLIIGAFYHFFFIGIFVSIRGILLDDIESSFKINHTLSGLIFLLPILPGILGNLLGGYLYTILNKKLLILSGSLILVLFLFILPYSNTYLLFLIIMFFLGIGSFLVSIGSNIAVPEYFNDKLLKYRDIAINILHFCFSFGAVTTMMIMSYFIKDKFGWRSIYFIIAFMPLFTLLLLLFSNFSDKNNINKDKAIGIRLKKSLMIIFERKMFFYALSIAFYTGIEIGIISWGPMFLKKGYGYDTEYSSFILMIFLILFGLGRFAGIFLTKLFNKVKLLFLFIFFLTISIILGFYFRLMIFHLDIFIIICGFFLSVIFPIIQSFMINDFYDRLSVATGIFFAASVTGGSFLPFVIGFLNDTIGEKYGILIILIYTLLIIPALIIAMKNKPAEN